MTTAPVFTVTVREAADQIASDARSLLRMESTGSSGRLRDCPPWARAEVKRLRRIARELRAALKVGQA